MDVTINYLVVLYFPPFCFLFFFNDTATTEIYTLSLHDALPISPRISSATRPGRPSAHPFSSSSPTIASWKSMRSEEHTSELQSRRDLVCRLLLEKKKDMSASAPEEARISEPYGPSRRLTIRPT